MTNLEYLAWFLEETYGAICFHNDPEDGYHLFPESDRREIETLAIYITSEIDFQLPTVKTRLEKKAGKDFFKRYIGANGMRLHPIRSFILLTRYAFDNKTILIDAPILSCPFAEVESVIEYFIGINIDLVFFKPANPNCTSAPTNNGFCVPYGCSVKKTLEAFLSNLEKPIITEKNGFFIRPTRPEQVIFDLDPFKKQMDFLFKEDWVKFKKLAHERLMLRGEVFKYASKEEINAFTLEMQNHPCIDSTIKRFGLTST